MTTSKSIVKQGRPTTYKKEFDEEVYRLTLLGLKDMELASFFGVTEKTLNNWKHKHKGFLQSLKKGKEQADAKVVESLYHRATGYEHPEDKIFNDNGEPLIVPTMKHYPPDVGAIALWLKNRQPDRWRDKTEGDNNTQVIINFDPEFKKLL